MSNDDTWLDGLRKHNDEWESYRKAIEQYRGVAMKIMKCCGKETNERWDLSTSKWVCSHCGTETSNDPSYTGYAHWSTPKQTDPKRCDCLIQNLMIRGCSCGGK